MKFGVLGTGMVGQTIAGKLVSLGHDVKLGAREATNEKAATWAKSAGANASAGTFADAAAFGDMIFNCTLGAGTLAALEAAGAANLRDKVLVDVSNPLDFSKGMPPSLFLSNTDSLGESIQRAFPATKVVKTLNTMNAYLMVGPAQLAGADHTVFVSGNDPAAKQRVSELLRSFGWKDIVDLGDITTARGTEMMPPIWLRAWGATGTPMFSFKLVR